MWDSSRTGNAGGPGELGDRESSVVERWTRDQWSRVRVPAREAG